MSFITKSHVRLSQRVSSNATKAFTTSVSSTKSHVDTEQHAVMVEGGPETQRMNLFTAINDALSIALKTDPTSILFGQGQ